MVEYRGYNGTISIDGDHLVITHHGLAAKASGLTTDTPRRFLLTALTDVHLRPASVLVNGALAVGFNGIPAPRKPAANCAEAVMFLKKDAAAFESLHGWLVSVAEKNVTGGATAQTPTTRLAGSEVAHARHEQQRHNADEAASLVRFRLWGHGWMEVAGERHHSREIEALFPERVPDDGTEAVFEADLVPEPTNRYDRHAIKVVINGQLVGYVPKEDAGRYQPTLVALGRQGLLGTVEARVWASPEIEYSYEHGGSSRRTGHLHARVTLSLAEPHLIVPLNTDPGGVELPRGRAVKVSPDGGAQQASSPWLRPEGEGWVYATLHRIEESLARSTRARVEARIDGIAFGTMTPSMSQNFLPVIDLLDERGRACAVRALLKGNKVKTDLSVHAAKASELSSAWLDEHVYALPIRDAAAQPRVADAPAVSDSMPEGWYDDPEGMAQHRYWDGAAWTSRIKM